MKIIKQIVGIVVVSGLLLCTYNLIKWKEDTKDLTSADKIDDDFYSLFNKQLRDGIKGVNLSHTQDKYFYHFLYTEKKDMLYDFSAIRFAVKNSFTVSKDVKITPNSQLAAADKNYKTIYGEYYLLYNNLGGSHPTSDVELYFSGNVTTQNLNDSTILLNYNMDSLSIVNDKHTIPDFYLSYKPERNDNPRVNLPTTSVLMNRSNQLYIFFINAGKGYEINLPSLQLLMKL